MNTFIQVWSISSFVLIVLIIIDLIFGKTISKHLKPLEDNLSNLLEVIAGENKRISKLETQVAQLTCEHEHLKFTSIEGCVQFRRNEVWENCVGCSTCSDCGLIIETYTTDESFKLAEAKYEKERIDKLAKVANENLKRAKEFSGE